MMSAGGTTTSWSLPRRVFAFIRTHFFDSPFDAALTVLVGVLGTWLVVHVADWAFVNAVWHGTSGADCRAATAGAAPGSVACWPFIGAKWPQFIYGTYPEAERWRVNLVFALGALGLGWLMAPRLPAKAYVSGAMVVLFPVLAFVLLTGGVVGLKAVPTHFWGGMLVTITLAASGIAASLPLGIFLALGRRSTLPLVRIASIAFIELWRGVPLVTVLYTASVMLPLFLPQGMTFDLLLRCIFGVALFSAAYMAEVVRGGLQAIPRGQYEAASALGLGYWRMMGLVVLPQALRLVIPGIVNTFIGLFKDTTLVLIVGLADFLGIIQRNLKDPNWLAPGTDATGYAFAAFVFWVFCFGMSRYARHMERQLNPQGGQS